MSILSIMANKLGVGSVTDDTDPTSLGLGLRHDATRVFKQEPFRAGLFVSEELDKAISRCKEKVNNIAEEYRSKNSKFRDLEFDLENDEDLCLYSLSHELNFEVLWPITYSYSLPNVHWPIIDEPADVLRVTEIFENPQFTIDGPQSSDIAQGRLGDCWFLSALAILASKPELLEKICVARDYDVGIYGFIFCRDGEWTDVIIDDQLFTTVPKFANASDECRNAYHNDKDLYDKVARKGGKTLYFARSTQENETWVPLIEKAYAKFHGDYQSLNYGTDSEALEDLTGGVGRRISISDIFDKDRFWREELVRTAQDRLFGCFSLGGDVEAEDNKGLLNNHDYSIIRAVEYKGKRFLKIRNPSATSEWTGPWSDGSKEWTREATREWRGVLEVLEHRFNNNDGAFIMEYEDFLEVWTEVTRTELFDPTWIQSSHWLNVTSRAAPCPWQYGDVSFTFSLPKASPATIVLSQADSRFWIDLSRTWSWSMDFLLFKRGSDRVMGRSDSYPTFSRSVTLTKELDAGDYVLHVRLDRRRAYRKDYIDTYRPNWDIRKLARVEAEKARSMSIAVNFDANAWQSKQPLPAELFAGRDLMEIEMAHFEANGEKHKALKALFTRIVTILADGEEKTKEPLEANTVTKETQSNVETETTEVSITIGPTEKNAIADKPAETTIVASTKTEPAVHEGIFCNGCKTIPIRGIRWRCLECDDYDLCSSCHSSGAHPASHQMLKFESPEKAEGLNDAEPGNDGDRVVVGLRVYTKSDAPVTISGQLRHGKLLSRKRK